ncbi:hypothetical protein [Blastopirellula marina]|uniref:Uncharacterized protein n=1 Tax=Blastopirellula marina DSM 3645 TaxID=314230 RepID=A4A0F2_9BACT|nr:hypothetical protein [Blastopirellula marina]EAQ77772.1 hypothetical protein DSM3645_25422 [Blastopirellula marina DSM 3645]
MKRLISFAVFVRWRKKKGPADRNNDGLTPQNSSFAAKMGAFARETPPG